MRRNRALRPRATVTYAYSLTFPPVPRYFMTQLDISTLEARDYRQDLKALSIIEVMTMAWRLADWPRVCLAAKNRITLLHTVTLGCIAFSGVLLTLKNINTRFFLRLSTTVFLASFLVACQAVVSVQNVYCMSSFPRTYRARSPSLGNGSRHAWLSCVTKEGGGGRAVGHRIKRGMEGGRRD